MKHEYPDKNQTIGYLLGEVNQEEFEKKYLNDEQSLEYILAIEEIMIEDYVLNKLEPRHRKLFEERFLISQEFKGRVEFNETYIELEIEKERIAEKKVWEYLKKELYVKKSESKNRFSKLLTIIKSVPLEFGPIRYSSCNRFLYVHPPSKVIIDYQRLLKKIEEKTGDESLIIKLLTKIKSYFELPRPGFCEGYKNWMYRIVHESSLFRFLIFLSVLVPVFVIFGIIFSDKTYFKWLPFLLQGLIIIFIYILTRLGTQSKYYFIDGRELFRSSIALKQFWKYWPRVWLTWVFLYLLLAFDQASSLLNEYNLQWLFHFLVNINTVFLFTCYFILTYRTVAVEKDIQKANKEKVYKFSGQVPNFTDHVPPKVVGVISFSWVNWTCFFFLIISVCEWAVQGTKKPEGLDNTILFLLNTSSFGFLFGMISVIVLGLLIEKIVKLSIPKSVIIFLFIYIAIQSVGELILPIADYLQGLYKTLNLKPETIKIIEQIFSNWAKPALAVIALIGKILLFTTLQWLATSHAFHYYMKEAAKDYSYSQDGRVSFEREIEKIEIKSDLDEKKFYKKLAELPKIRRNKISQLYSNIESN